MQLAVVQIVVVTVVHSIRLRPVGRGRRRRRIDRTGRHLRAELADVHGQRGLVDGQRSQQGRRAEVAQS